MKYKVMVFMFLLFFCSSISRAEIRSSFNSGKVDVVQLTNQLAKNFTRITLAKLNQIPEIKSSNSWPTIKQKVLNYAKASSEMLLGGGLTPELSELVIERCASWYAKVLTEIVKGKSIISATNEYINNVNYLFNQLKLNPSLQEKLIALIKVHLKRMGPLLEALKSSVEESNPQPSP